MNHIIVAAASGRLIMSWDMLQPLCDFGELEQWEEVPYSLVATVFNCKSREHDF